MGFNFRKSLSIGKLFRINFSKSGIGVSAGVKGARFSIGKKGLRQTLSLPGTGLSWSEQQSFKKIKKAITGKDEVAAPAKPKKNRKWLQLIWVAVVAGAFMLYQSGALDAVMTNVKNAFSGKPQPTVAASAVPAAEADPVAVAGTPVAATSMEAVAGTRTIQLKDSQVTLAADTLYVASKSGSKFHKTDCSVLKSIATANLVEYASRDVADAKKDPCSICNP